MDSSIIIPILSILCAVGLPIVFLTLVGIRTIQSRHEERMAMIAQGIIPEYPEKKANRFNALRNGILLVSIAFGALTAIFFSSWLNDKYVALFLCIFPILFGGIGYLVYFFTVKNMEKNEPAEKKEE